MYSDFVILNTGRRTFCECGLESVQKLALILTGVFTVSKAFSDLIESFFNAVAEISGKK